MRKKTNVTDIVAEPAKPAPSPTINLPPPQPVSNPISSVGVSALEKIKAQVAKNREEVKLDSSTPQETNLAPVLNETVSESDFLKCFEIYLKTLETTGKSRVSAFLKDSPISWIEPCTAELELKSEMELEMINEERLNFMPWFRDQLKNGNFDIKFKVNKDRILQVNKVSKADQLKMMIEKNPIIGEFVQGLGLEIDY